MTYIEFFDRLMIENICSSLRRPPDRVILIGNSNQMETCAERFREVLLGRGADVEFICRKININDMMAALSLLEELVTSYDDCVIDLTGGSDILLTASGMVFERHPEKHIQLHRILIGKGDATDCDMDGSTVDGDAFPELTVDENIRIYGGRIVYEDERCDSTVIWDLDGDFIEDVDVMWRICRSHYDVWNKNIGRIAYLDAAGGADDLGLDRALLQELEDAGLMWLEDRSGSFVPVFKDAQIRKCLTVSGLVLELKIYITASGVRDRNGSPVYCDVMNGVHIDWDGKTFGENATNTENEVDVIMMHGMVPVFVSCKNGHAGIDELYKLSVVAERFGGRYAKKVLLMSSVEQDKPTAPLPGAAREPQDPDRPGLKAASLADRAKEMGIKLVTNVKNLDDAALEQLVAKLWK